MVELRACAFLAAFRCLTRDTGCYVYVLSNITDKVHPTAQAAYETSQCACK
jgi:hypothetical protein